MDTGIASSSVSHSLPPLPESLPAEVFDAPTAAAERRASKRAPLRVDVDIDAHDGHRFYTGFSDNISCGGLFIATHVAFDIGTQLPLTFTVPGYDREVHVQAEVRWLRDGDPDDPYRPPGMGVRFVDLGPVEERAINAFIRGSETLFYDDE